MASDSRILCFRSIIFIALCSISLSESRKLELTLNTRKAMHHLSPYFLSISLDPTVLVNETTGVSVKDGFDTVKVVNMAKGLSPAYLRIGGPSTDRKFIRFKAFSLDDEDENESDDETYENMKSDSTSVNKITFNGAQLAFLHHFAEEAGLKIVLSLGYDLEKQKRKLRKGTYSVLGHSNEESDDSEAWNLEEALDIIRFSDSMDMKLGYQLGYEADFMNVANNLKSRMDNSDGASESYEELAIDGKASEEEAGRLGVALGNDLIRLRTLLDAFPHSRGSIILSPGICLPAAYSGYRSQPALHSTYLEPYSARRFSAFLHGFLEKSGDALTTLVWHPSSFSAERSEKESIAPEKTLAAVHEKDGLLKIIGRSMANKPMWIGESWDDGIESTSQTNKEFEDALIWAQRLGVAAKMGSQVILHSPKSTAFHGPNSQYWVSLLHKKLAGETVLDTRLTGGNSTKKDINVFAHCTPHSTEPMTLPVDKFPHGSVTLFAVNPNHHSSEIVIRVNSGFRNLYHQDLYKGTSAPVVYEYVLTEASMEGISPSDIGKTLLNGEPLEMDESGALPHLKANVIEIKVQENNGMKKILKRTVIDKHLPKKSTKVPMKEKYASRKTKRGINSNGNMDILLSLQPKSVTFWVLPPSMGVRPCLGEEIEADEERMVYGNAHYSPPKFRENKTREAVNEEESAKEKRETKIESGSIKEGDADGILKGRRKRQISSRPLPYMDLPKFGQGLKKMHSLGFGSGKMKHGDGFDDEEAIPARRYKKKRKENGKGAGPKVLSFNVGTEDDENESGAAYAKGTVYLSDDVASSSKEDDEYIEDPERSNDYEYVDEDDEDEEIEPEVIVKTGHTQTLNKHPSQASTKDSNHGYYHGPGDYFMEYQQMVESGTGISGIKESSNELFEAEFSSKEDKADMGSLLKEIVVPEDVKSIKEDGIFHMEKSELSLEAAKLVKEVKENVGIDNGTFEPSLCIKEGKRLQRSSSEVENPKEASGHMEKVIVRESKVEDVEKGIASGDQTLPHIMKKEDDTDAEIELDDPLVIEDVELEKSEPSHKKTRPSNKKPQWISIPADGDPKMNDFEAEKDETLDNEDSPIKKKGKGRSQHKSSLWIPIGNSDPKPTPSQALKPWEIKSIGRRRRDTDEAIHGAEKINCQEHNYTLSNLKSSEPWRYAPTMKDISGEMKPKLLNKRENKEAFEDKEKEDTDPGVVRIEGGQEEKNVSVKSELQEGLNEEQVVSKDYNSTNSEMDAFLLDLYNSRKGGNHSEKLKSDNVKSENLGGKSQGTRKKNSDGNSVDGSLLDELKLENLEINRLPRQPKIPDRIRFNLNPISQQLGSEHNETAGNESKPGSDGNDTEKETASVPQENNPINTEIVDTQSEKENQNENGDNQQQEQTNENSVTNNEDVKVVIHTHKQENEKSNDENESQDEAQPINVVIIGSKKKPLKKLIIPTIKPAPASLFKSTQNKYSNQLTIMEKRRQDLRKLEAQRRKKMEAARRQAAEERRRIIDAIRKRMENSRPRKASDVGQANVPSLVLPTFEELRTRWEELQSLIAGNREKRDLKSRRQKIAERTMERRKIAKNKRKAIAKKRGRLSKLSKDRQRRDLMQFMYDDSANADHHRVPRIAPENEQNPQHSNEDCGKDLSEKTDQKPSSRSHSCDTCKEWTIDKKFAFTDEKEDFVELLAGGQVSKEEKEGTGNLWPETFNKAHVGYEDPYFTIDTSKQSSTSNLGALGEIFTGSPYFLSNQDLEEINEELKSEDDSAGDKEEEDDVALEDDLDDEKYEDKYYKMSPKEEKILKDETKLIGRLLKAYSDNEAEQSKKENKKEDDAGKSSKRIRRHIPGGGKDVKINRRKTRMINTLSYEANEIYDGDTYENFRNNKIRNYGNENKENENVLFVLLGDRQNKKNENGIVEDEILKELETKRNNYKEQPEKENEYNGPVKPGENENLNSGIIQKISFKVKEFPKDLNYESKEIDDSNVNDDATEIKSDSFLTIMVRPLLQFVQYINRFLQWPFKT